MKFSEHWLRTVFDPAISSEALSHVLTMAGLEVEQRDPVALAFSGVVVGEITSVEAHPDADRLRICRVDIGAEALQVVCGAPNVRVGMRVACALAGAQLPGAAVKQAKVRGVESSGMLCSERELGLGDDHSGVLDLGSGESALGEDLRKVLELDDHAFTLKLTPNRGDCLSIQGLARELAALMGKALPPRPTQVVASQASDQREIRLEAGSACPRYFGRVITGLDGSAPTPPWMVRRLQRSGVRPISALVDITNYVMLEMGQPLHAFDHARLQGSICVRQARAGERLQLLDGRVVELQSAHLVIADDSGPVALAGVMGGEGSAVAEHTSAVFLESAFFAPEAVAAASRGLEIASDAAHRFERGVDFELAGPALERATALVLEICGGLPGPLAEARGVLPSRAAIEFRPERVRRVLGVDIAVDQIVAMLRRLGMTVQAEEGALVVVPPSFRFDVNIEVDLIEEVARVHGYERIAPSLPQGRPPMLAVQERVTSVEALKRALADRDYFEVVTFSFVDRQLELDFASEQNPVALANPIASQLSVMRSTLIGSLVECARFNIARKQERVRIFETAACFSGGADGFKQVERMTGLCYGSAMPEQWGDGGRIVDFFDVRGDLEALLGAAHLSFVPAVHPAFHPGQTAQVFFGGRSAGWLGVLHPRWLQKYELAATAVAFELDLAMIRATDLPAYQPLSRFPPVRRDLAIMVDEGVPASALKASILRGGAPLVNDVNLFDVYRGKGVPDGRKSLAFRVLLQDTEKTLTDSEVEAAVRKITTVLQEKHGATLRL
jgi:phenylalanyl-tRNA synthetase beta chain